MKPVRSLPLKLWLPLFLTTASLVVMTGLFWNTYRAFKADLVESSIQQVTRDLAELQRDLEQEARTVNSQGAPLALMGTDTRYQLLIATDENNRVVHATRFALRGESATRLLAKTDLRHLLSADWEHRHQPEVRIASNGQQITAYFPLKWAPLTGGTRALSGGTLLAIFDLSAAQAKIWNQTWQASWPIGGLALLITGILALLARRYWLQPVEHLGSVVSAIGKGDTGIRSEIIGKGEIATLAAGIGVMNQQLQERFEQRRQAETALQQSQEYLSTLFHSIGDAVIATDPLGRVTQINPVAEQLTGWTTDNATGQPVTEVFRIISEEPGESAETFILRVVASGEPVRLSNNTVLQAKDGPSYQITASAAPITTPRGDIRGVVLVFRDITEAFGVRKALAEREERLQLVMSVINEGIWDWQLGEDGYRIVFDDRYFTMAGYQPGDYTDEIEEFRKRVHPDDWQKTESALTDYLAGRGETYDIEFRFLRKEGSYMWIRDRGKIVARNSAGKPTRIIGTHTDITELKQTATVLRRAQRMETVGQLTGGIAHDFNNILGIIIGNVGLLEGQPELGKKSRARIESISTAARRAADLTQQLLGFSRKQPERIVVTNINRLIAGMKTLTVRALTPEIEIKSHLPDDLWLTSIDPGEFQDALLNLVINARDGMNGQGILTLETQNTVLDAHFCAQYPELKPGDYVELSITDTGAGISPQLQERIFEPFFTTKGPGKGTGLGLSMVFGFVNRSGGIINLYSEENIGTTFRLYLPRAQAEQPTAAAPLTTAKEPPRGSQTILVVDDEPALVALAETVLGDLGYRIFTAANGTEALALLTDRSDIDLLLSDVVMPGPLNGYQLAEQAVTLHPELKILLASGYSEHAVASNGQARFTANLLKKPYTAADLAEQISAALQNAPQ